jgi:hypothetical protein
MEDLHGALSSWQGTILCAYNSDLNRTDLADVNLNRSQTTSSPASRTSRSSTPIAWSMWEKTRQTESTGLREEEQSTGARRWSSWLCCGVARGRIKVGDCGIEGGHDGGGIP